MTSAQILQVVWAIIVIWYVSERIMVAQGRFSERHPAHNPAGAAMRFWSSFWDNRPAALGLCALVLAAHLLVCLSGFVWRLLVDGSPTGLSSPAIQRLLLAQPLTAMAAVKDPVFRHTIWLQFADALVVYPAFKPGYLWDVLGPLLLAAFTGWVILNRRAITAPDRIRPGGARAAWQILLIGFLSTLVLLGLSAAPPGGRDPQLIAFATITRLISLPIMRGGALGILAMVLVEIVMVRRISMIRVAGRWLRSLPGFVLLAVTPTVAALCARLLAPDLESGQASASAAALWLVSRVSWLAVMPVMIWLAFEAGNVARGVHEVQRIIALHGRDLLAGLVRGAAILAPALIGLRLLNVLAPATALAPGAAVMLASWLVGITCLGAALTIYRDTVKAPQAR